MAINTFKSFLMIGTDTGSGITYEKLCDIKSFSDLEKAPDNLDTTTMSDPARTFILGIQESENITFSLNYDLAVYHRIKALAYQIQYLSVWFGGDLVNGVAVPSGSEGKFSFEGYIAITKDGGNVNEVQNMTLTISPSSVIVEEAGGTGVPFVQLSTHVVNIVDGNSVKVKVVTNPADAVVTWSSSAAGKASVANGVITGEDAGSAIITAAITVEGVTYNDTLTAIVSAAE